MPNPQCSVLIIDDVDDMRAMLATLIEGIPGLRVSGQAANGWDARMELDRRCPDLILLDEILPGESSLDLMAEFRDRGVAVILVTGVLNPTHALPKGAYGRLIKPGWDTLDVDRARFSDMIFKAVDGAR